MNRAPKLAAFGSLVLLLFCFPGRAATNDLSGQPIYRILCVGDAIVTSTNASIPWQFPLWEKLLSAGYLLEYVGSQNGDSRIGLQKHESYANKPAEAIATNAIAFFRKQPADLVLIALPGDHTAPSVECMIHAFREANPKVIVLLAQPARDHELAKLARALNTPEQPVTSVAHAADAKKMTARWFAALTKILEPPKQTYHPKTVVYKKASGADLTLHIFKPAAKTHAPHPAIVFFYGGGWKNGTPIQFYNECTHFAESGFVAISADYRIESVEHTPPYDSVTDGKSAIRWVRQHARELNIDPNRIVGSGASAGGQVITAAACLPGFNDPADDLAVSPRPDALVLWYAVVNNGPGGYGYSRIKDRYLEFSPFHNITDHMPPMIYFLGTKDPLTSVAIAKEFKSRVEQKGGRCDLLFYENSPHVIYDYRKGDCPLRRETLAAADTFLTSIGFMPATKHSR